MKIAAEGRDQALVGRRGGLANEQDEGERMITERADLVGTRAHGAAQRRQAGTQVKRHGPRVLTTRALGHRAGNAPPARSGIAPATHHTPDRDGPGCW